MITIFSLLRIKSWVKNGFLLLPAVFSLHLFTPGVLSSLCIGFLAFSLSCSFVYIINDIQDRERDQLHPRKKLRPIASGKVSVRSSLFAALVCLSIALFLAYSVLSSVAFTLLMLGYVAVNVGYSFGLKNIPLLELIVVSVNFVLRVLAGCVILKETPSHWILVVTFFMSLFLVVVKRKSELLQLNMQATAHRKSLASYTLSFLNVLIYISATVTLTAYLLYSMDPVVIHSLGSSNVLYSSLFVLLGLIRYIQISELSLYEGEGDPTTLLFKDGFLLATICAWVFYLVLIIYV